jgi:hypothetical protein
MQNKILLLIIGISLSLSISGQTLFVPIGTNGIGTSGNDNVGIGTSTPGEKFEVVGVMRTINLGSAAATWDNLSLWSDGENSYIHANGDEKGLRIKSNTGGKILLESNVGIGTTMPRAKLDVGAFINNGQLGTVLGRLEEGNDVGDGTYLGIKGYETQAGQYNLKSFALEHHFYGVTNSSINFYRGGDSFGGYLTFNTRDNSERMRIDGDGNVGIGTGAPRQRLEVAGSSLFDSDMFTLQNGGIFFSGNGSYSAGIYGRNAGTDLVFNSGGAEKMRINSNGNLGIGTANPQSQLHIGGNSNSIISIGSVSYAGNSGQALAAIQVTQGGCDGGIINFQVNPWNQTGSTGIYTPITRMIINQYGNVGIGTVNPDYKLDVLGTIRAKEVLVNLDGGADFVFEKDYKLLPIEDVATYVQENKHLPNIPSANEMTKNGVSMGDMQVKLLQKVEELTLYVIELKKEIETMKKQPIKQ